MTLDRKLVEKASIELWNQYHSKIEELGYSLSKNSMIHSLEGISIVATITPNYSSKMGKIIRKIIPMNFEYFGEKIPVIIMPSVNNLL